MSWIKILRIGLVVCPAISLVRKLISGRDLPMCCSMKVLSVRGTLFLPILVCPLFRMSSRTDFKLGNLLGTLTCLALFCLFENHNTLKKWSTEVYSPPGHIGL